MNPKIDILMATYNGEKYIYEQLESILNQTYKNINIIISDDCSKDNTVNIIKEFEKKDNRITVYEQKKNLGVVKNIEFLLKKVENEYYMLSDQDDIWLPQKIEKSMECLVRTNADLVFGDLEVVNQDLKTMYPSFGDYMLLNKKIKKYINSYKINYLYNCVTGCTILSKKIFIPKIIPIPTDSKYVLHDHWIGLILSLNGRLTYIDEKYIKYRQHGNNEVGTDKISHRFKKLNQVRDLFINVKLGVFGVYVRNNNVFPKNMQILNNKAYEYFKDIQKKRFFNLKNWGIFHKLYKTENFKYYVENFIIMNFPIIGAPIFKARYYILKIIRNK